MKNRFRHANAAAGLAAAAFLLLLAMDGSKANATCPSVPFCSTGGDCECTLENGTKQTRPCDGPLSCGTGFTCGCCPVLNSQGHVVGCSCYCFECEECTGDG